MNAILIIFERKRMQSTFHVSNVDVGLYQRIKYKEKEFSAEQLLSTAMYVLVICDFFFLSL